MSDMLNIKQGIIYDNSITKHEYHTYSSFLISYNTGDEIRISVQHQDLYLLPCESFLYIEAAITKTDGTAGAAKLSNNSIAFLFDEIRYELNGVEIDRTRNTGITSTLKNYISFDNSESNSLLNAGWSPKNDITPTNGHINFCIPLKILFGFAEDYKKIIINAKHELILNRARTDDNAVSSMLDYKFQIFKLQWRIPHLTVADNIKLGLLKISESNQPIQMSFRNWDMYEYPVLPQTNHHSWVVKTSTQLEKPRYIVFALQTDRKNQKSKDSSKFDHCNLTDIKVHLNSETYPYDDLNIKFARDRYALLYEMYKNFQQSYYGRQSEPCLSWVEFKSTAPIIVIDCSHQNESIKSGPVDVRLEFKTSENIPQNTSAYCLLLHDRIIEYNPFTSEVRKLI